MKNRVGILLVHGVGEQRKFEHLESVVRNIATTLKAEPHLSVNVAIKTREDGHYGAEQPFWAAEAEAPIVMSVKNNAAEAPEESLTELSFREVWWADLDDPPTLSTQLWFWVWGLSLWIKRQYHDLKYGKGAQEMHVGFSRPVNGLDRLRLFGFSFVVLLLLPLPLLSSVLRNLLGSKLRPDIFVQYLGDIKLFQQGAGKGALSDLGQPPRATIRRRMVKALVQMALDDCDRWYVMAHSLGSVLALNGLMETESALPNYLDQALWQRWQADHDRKADVPIDPDRPMMPERPHWLADDDIISRADLFAKLRGVLTYGSPLSKFAVLWPAIAPLNNDETVFPANCEWINVYDPTDPIADATQYFDPDTPQGLTPKDLAYKAKSIHLLSHRHYLDPRRDGNGLVNHVTHWLLTPEETFPMPKPSWRWPDNSKIQLYKASRVAIWVGLAFAIALLLSHLVPTQALPDWPLLSRLDLTQPLTYFGLTAAAVLAVGSLSRVLSALTSSTASAAADAPKTSSERLANPND